MAEGHHFLTDLLTGAALRLGAALVAVLLFRKLGLGAVLGYLVAGIVIGPDGLGLSGDPETILGFAEVGIILLLFLVGLELSPSRLWLMRRDILLFGPLQVALCGLAMFAIISFVLPFSWQAALVLGLPLGLSSTAQVLPLLQSRGRLKTDYGEKSFAILLFQDISIVPLLTIVAALSRAPAAEGAPSGFLLAIYAVLAIAGLILAGRYILSPLLRLVGRVSERELFIVTGLFAVCASAALMQSIGVSAALGAFVAGVMLADSPYRHELEADIDPFRSILLGLFFLAVGMMLDIDVIIAEPLLIVGLAATLVAVKTAIIFGLGRLFGLGNRPSIVMALLLSQGGEFGFVLFAASQGALLVEPEAASLFGAIITLSMATTPFLMILAQRLAREIRQAGGHQVTRIDIKPQQIERSQIFGRQVFYGDGTRIDLLERAGAAEACAIFFCIDDRELDAETLEPLRHHFPKARIFVRAYDRRQALALMPDGGLRVTREVFESSISMAQQALLELGASDSAVMQAVDEFRRRDGTRLAEQFASGNMHAGAQHSFGGDDSDDFALDKG
ncbi:MAG: cation:proton antiporter [Sphingomonadales bacterium]|nr:cation:proton antiporter [Sphingomonadales bacterium]